MTSRTGEPLLPPEEEVPPKDREYRLEREERMYQSKIQLRVAAIFEPIFWIAVFFFAYLFQVPCRECVWLHVGHFLFVFFVITTLLSPDKLFCGLRLQWLVLGFIGLGVLVLGFDIVAVLVRVFGCSTQPFMDTSFMIDNFLRDCTILWLAFAEVAYAIYTAIVIGLLFVYYQELVDYKQKQD